MMRQLPDYMNAIGIRRTFTIISTYIEIRKPYEEGKEDSNLNSFV